MRRLLGPGLGLVALDDRDRVIVADDTRVQKFESDGTFLLKRDVPQMDEYPTPVVSRSWADTKARHRSP